ncbi:hypothetical protein Vadar_022877 [Vaccinium darrowii]|uniref:Uncharacterized protein n=1 Tax=Vaccinium darrowii TaxID=229202 RepID=A0ACB7ZKV5_9ERIC|nr:hypothetical protein Vadar_022877 [Vaccinium darrowii]
MALIEAAMVAARSSLSSPSQLQKNVRSIQSITLLLKRRLSREGQPSSAGGDIEDAGSGCSSRTRNRVFESLLHSWNRGYMTIHIHREKGQRQKEKPLKWKNGEATETVSGDCKRQAVIGASESKRSCSNF